MADQIRGVKEPKSGSDAFSRIAVNEWLAKTFEAAGKPVLEFEYTPRSVVHLHTLLTVSKAKDEATCPVARDFRKKASKYRSQAMGDISLRKTGVEEKRAIVQKESKVLLHYTRKAIARLTYLKRILAQLEDEVAPFEVQMENWKTNLQVMAAKERQYKQQCTNCIRVLNHAGYTPEISHRVLVEMAEHKKELEKKTKPILDTQRSYQDLPPDKALAAFAIEDKKRQYAAAEKYLEDVLQSALANSG